MRKILFFLFIIFAFSLYADLNDTTGVKIKRVTVQSNRDDGHFFQNRLVIQVYDQNDILITFNGRPYLHLDITDTVARSVQAQVLLAAQNSYTVDIGYNTNEYTALSYEIAYIAVIFP